MISPREERIKLHWFNERMNAVYKANGVKALPFDEEEMKAIIEKCQEGLKPLFVACFDDMGEYMLDKFYGYNGNVFGFVDYLDSDNLELFRKFDW